jgi:Na+/proline symporter
MKHIDTAAIRKARLNKSAIDIVYGIAFILGLILVVFAGIMVGGLLFESRVGLLVPLAFVAIYLYALARLRVLWEDHVRLARYRSE